MIRTIQALAMVLALSPLAAFAGTPVDVKVEGMSCGACVKKVNDELAKLSDVEKGSVKVSLKGEHATLTLKNNDASSLEAVKAAVTKAGYKVAKIDVLTEGTKAAEKSATKTN